MQKVVYLNISQITEVHNKKVKLSDVATVYCSDSALANRCGALIIKHIKEDRDKRYVMEAMDVISQIMEMDSSIQVNNVGEVQFIVDYQHDKPPRLFWQWVKTWFVCAVSFSGGAFAIMTFNNDANVSDIFKEVYLLIMGKESNGFTILELSYSIGLALGIIVFFNHFAKWKLNTDPTPLEVEMRLYEENVCKTLIQNDGRKEKGIDVS